MKTLYSVLFLLGVSFTYVSAQSPKAVGGSEMVKDVKDAALSSKLPQGEIRVFQVKGVVEIVDRENNVIERVKRGQVLKQGVILKSGEDSGALLMLSNGSTMNLGANSRFEIAVFLQESFDQSKGRFAMLKEDPSTSKMHAFLHQGELLGNVKKLHTSSTFAVETPTGTAGVRGTTFYVSFGVDEATGDYMMRISNLDGSVVVESPLGAQVVMSDGSVAAGKYDPYSGPKLYEVPAKSVIIIMADKSLNLGNIKNMPKYSAITSFKAFTNGRVFQAMLQELGLAIGGKANADRLFSPTGNETHTVRDLPVSP